MKKIICFLLSVAVLISSGVFLLSYAANINTENISAEQFASDISGMIKASSDSTGLPGKENSYNSETEEFRTSRLIVKSKYRIDTSTATSVVCGYDDLWVLQYNSPEKALEAYKNFENSDNIEFVEADRELSGLFSETSVNFMPESYSQTDDNSYLSWGPEYIGADILNNNILLEQIETKDTVVAVIDTGVDPNHPYLKGRVIPTRINTSTSGTRNNSMDDNGHGTQVAGVIVDTTLDNIYIKPYKVLDSLGSGTMISLAAGINCAIEDGVDIINISVGFEEESDVLKNAIDNAEINDILVVAASGNDGTDKKYYPASYDNVLKITAINKQGTVCNFSTYDNGVDFAAPGFEITTTNLNNGYIKTRGTSVAAPFVTAVAAIIISYKDAAPREEIIEILTIACVGVSEHISALKYGNGVLRAPEQPDREKVKELVATPYFSHQTAFSQSELDIEIFCDTPGAQIYYTTDRSIPVASNPNAIFYDGKPIHASQTIILTAVAYCEGMYRSRISSFATIIAPYVSSNTLTVSPNGTLMAYNGTETSFTIPETVNGVKINKIGSGAFENKNVTEVILPDSVTTIENNAFNNCTQLKTIYAKNVTYVGDYAFNNCEWLKNVLIMSEVTSVGKYAFNNAGQKQNIFTGSTFTLKLKKLTTIPEGAFSNSAISSLELGKVKSISKTSFSGCNQLVSVEISNLMNMPEGCFKGCLSLTDVKINGLAYIPAGAFSGCENLIQASFPDVKNVFSNAFENCVSLALIELPSAVEIYSNAFNGCTNLYVLNLPELRTFEESVYTTTNPKIYLPANLKKFYATKFEKTVARMFSNTPAIEIIGLNGVKNIAADTFKGCYKIYSLNIEGVEKISHGAFNECSITFIDARSLITTADMPDNSGILLSNNFVESTDIAENMTVYGTKNTFVERYANLKGYEFIEIPLIYSDMPEYITENSETVYILAAGFDLTYQWYWNTRPETSGGTPIEGATTQAYTFTNSDTAPYYYCEITQNDLGVITVITTDIITKDTVPADYTAYNEAVAKAKEIDRSLYSNLLELDEALETDVSGRYSCEQDIVDTQTKAILDAIERLMPKIIRKIDLYASDTELSFLEAERIISVLQPIDAQYTNAQWVSDDEDVLLVSSSGRVRCIGDGSVTVRLRVENIDGSITEGTITFECELSLLNKIVSFLLKDFFKLLYK